MLGIEEGGGANGLGAATRRQRERDCEVFTGRKVASLRRPRWSKRGEPVMSRMVNI
jgi:hypothetical protein